MRKAILLAMTVAIVAMFAIPGTASASWTKHHVVSPNTVELEITTTDFFYESSIGGDTCNSIISRVDLEGGKTTGTITTFEPEKQITVTANCQGRGALGGCDIHESAADQLPWVIHTATSDTVTITTGTMTTTLSGFLCPHTVAVTPGTLTWTVAAGQTNTTSTLTLSGVLIGHVGSSEVNTNVSGTSHVLGTITYGI